MFHYEPLKSEYSEKLPKPKNLDRPLTIEEAHKVLALAAREDYEVFYYFMTGFRFSDFHKEWVDAFNNPHMKRIVIEAFRESAKTSTTIYYMAWYMANNPLSTNAIIGVTEDLAIQRLRLIRELIEHNDHFKMVFPNIEIDRKQTNNTKAFNLVDTSMPYNVWRSKVQREGELKDHTIRGVGIGSSVIIGNRYTGITLLDDIVSENTLTEGQIAKTSMWFKRTLLPCIKDEGKLISIGTRFQPVDFIGNLKADHEEILKNGQVSPYTFFNTPVYTSDPDTGEIVLSWPEVWPMERIEAKKIEVGLRVFKTMYLNNPNAWTSPIFNAEDLDNKPPPITRIKTELELVIVSVDPAFTQKSYSDYSAIGVFGKWEDKLVGFRMLRGKYTPKQLKTGIINMVMWAVENLGKCDGVVIEKVAAQTLLVDSIQDEFSKSNISVIGYRVPGKNADKVSRSMRLSNLAESGNYLCFWDHHEFMIHNNELLEFPASSSNDDTVDSATQAANFLFGAVLRMNTKVHELNIF